MNKILFIISLTILLGCQHKNKNIATITFQIDMSEVIHEISDPETIGIVGSGPLEWKREAMQDMGDDIYSVTFEWPAENPDTMIYTFMHSYDIFDDSNIGVAAYRTLIVTPGKHILPIVKWGENTANTGLATPSPMLKVEQSDTEAEKKALRVPYYGVTADGERIPDLYSINATGISTAGIKKAVEDFLNSLSIEQREICMFPIDHKEWRRWSNIDSYKRKGIGLPDLTEDQKELAFSILKESLSPKGFQKTQDIMKMEAYLAQLANDFEMLGPDLYWFTFMGIPSDTEPWGWQIDGHHLVINYFILGDQIVMTPAFMGSEPNYIAEGENTGTRTFENEEKLGLAFYHSLESEQRKTATLFNRKDYNYNQAASFDDNAIVPYSGLNVIALDETQMNLLQELISEYIGNIKEGHAEVRMDEILEHMDHTYFAWIGGSDENDAFYYRIQSPVVLIEFDHQTPVFLPGNKPSKKHVHTLVRTPNGNDYGKDLLRQHLEKDHQH
jgi:hypothetical protein